LSGYTTPFLSCKREPSETHSVPGCLTARATATDRAVNTQRKLRPTAVSCRQKPPSECSSKCRRRSGLTTFSNPLRSSARQSIGARFDCTVNSSRNCGQSAHGDHVWPRVQPGRRRHQPPIKPTFDYPAQRTVECPSYNPSGTCTLQEPHAHPFPGPLPSVTRAIRGFCECHAVLPHPQHAYPKSGRARHRAALSCNPVTAAIPELAHRRLRQHKEFQRL
jgi:hypothetical protein